LNGLGSLPLTVVGNVVGTLQAAWRDSRGAASTVVARNGRMMEYFMMMGVRLNKTGPALETLALQKRRCVLI